MDKQVPVELPPITRISPSVIRVLGQNPGPYTLQGTNTYLLGRRPPYVLLDTGEGKSEYIPVLERALTDEMKDTTTPAPNGPFVSDLILSHKHPDHHGGIHSVLVLLKQLWDRHHQSLASNEAYTPPRLHKFASFSKTPDRWDTLLDASLTKINTADGLFSVPAPSDALSGTPEVHRFHKLKEGQEFLLTGEGDTAGSVIRVFHTPGHTDDSICLSFPEDNALFTFDSVLGQGTAVFEDLSQYLSSLRRLLDLNAQGETTFVKLYPGHGPVVENGEELIKQYINHRLEREEQLLKLLGSRGEGEDRNWTVDQLLEKIYPPNVREMARRGVLLHLHKLEVDGKASRSQHEGVDTWALV